MALMFLAAMMMAQAPSVASSVTQPTVKVKKQKVPQICEDIELTGSRAKRHVCHDANVDAGTLLGVSHSIGGKGRIDQQDGQSTGGPGGSS